MLNSRAATILVTGVTGNVGSRLAGFLAIQGIPFRAMVRSVATARRLPALANAELVAGDFNDPEAVAKALSGIDKAFLLSNSSAQAEAQQLGFVDVAKRIGTQHIVKLSQWAADIESPVRFLRYHAVVEQRIRDAGLAYTFLRPNLFMQGLLGFSQMIAKQGKFFASIGDARISAVDVRDIAAVAATVLSEQGHAGQVYNLTGPEAITHTAMAAKISDACGRRVQFETIEPSTMRQALTIAGFPPWQVEGLIEDYAHYAREEAALVTDDIMQVTGRQPLSFNDFARDYAKDFA